MDLLEFSTAVFIFSYFAGLLGALTGLGGGVVIIPILVLILDVNLHQAMGASLVAAIATSSVTAIAFMRQNYTNIRIAMLLEVGAIVGSIIGALLVPFLPIPILSVMFGFFILLCIYASLRKFGKDDTDTNLPPHPWVKKLNLSNSYPIYHVPQGMGLMGVAGLSSGLFGIGSGALKVLIFDLTLKMPYKVATCTSNFMVGMTAAASAGIYSAAGYINPYICFPVLPGIVLGAFTGSQILVKARVNVLRLIFNIILLILALQMIYKGIKGL